jgi:hypothetical protein
VAFTTQNQSAQSARGLALRALLVTLTIAAALLLQVLTSTAAHASDYRYWTFWTGNPDGTWTFAQKGPADIKVTDNFVEGWRFTISPASGGSPQPRITAIYNQLCPSLTVPAGKVGVAVVIDYGINSEAPTGETPPAGPVTKCVAIPSGSSAADALAAAGTVRANKGLVCGINGYPATECGVAVAALPSPSESTVPGGLKPTKAPVDGSGLPSQINPDASVSIWPYVVWPVVFFGGIILVSWFFLRMRKNSLQPPKQ